MLNKIIILFLVLLSFADAFGQRRTGARRVTAGATNYLLDNYPGAAAAYAMNKLKSDATNCVTILRASDNDTLVVGFSGDDFDSSAASAFVSSGHGYVIRWWDQSGNNRNFYQTDTALCPKIIENGSLITVNGVPSISFDGENDVSTGDILQGYELTAASSAEYYCVIYPKGASESGRNGGVFTATDATNTQHFSGDAEPSYDWYDAFFATSRVQFSNNDIPPLVQYLAVGINTGSNLSGRLNGVLKSGGSVTFDGTVAVRMDSNATGATRYELFANYQLLIIYTSDQSINRTGIESAINTYYSIY